MNDIINKFLLAEDKFKPEIHLKQLGGVNAGSSKCMVFQIFKEVTC